VGRGGTGSDAVDTIVIRANGPHAKAETTGHGERPLRQQTRRIASIRTSLALRCDVIGSGSEARRRSPFFVAR
jgi:hypothetical protein